MSPEAALRISILTCRACPLRATCRQPVPWSTYPSPTLPAAWAIRCEAPGADEDLACQVLVGRAGKLLDACLREARVAIPHVRHNVVACRPPNNDFSLAVREGAPEACRPHREALMALADPVALVLAGESAFLSETLKGSFASWRGRHHVTPRRVVLVTHHPARILREPSLRPEFVAHLARIPTLIALGKVARVFGSDTRLAGPDAHYRSLLDWLVVEATRLADRCGDSRREVAIRCIREVCETTNGAGLAVRALCDLESWPEEAWEV